ncbi:MAG TPA: tetratricopeptide repeat protein, partial [Anaerolineae bacterium]|nr:tetratricopeptide repeat protein [Anaerolineae bacterium]
MKNSLSLLEPDPFDFWLEHLHHLLNHDPTSGLQVWTRAFDRALRSWDAERCHLLLAEAQRNEGARSPRGRALALHRHGVWLTQQGRWSEAINRFEQSLSVFRQSGDTLGETQALNELGNVYQAIGDWVQAAAYYQRALPLQRAEGDRHQEAITLNNLAAV